SPTKTYRDITATSSTIPTVNIGSADIYSKSASSLVKPASADIFVKPINSKGDVEDIMKDDRNKFNLPTLGVKINSTRTVKNDPDKENRNKLITAMNKSLGNSYSATESVKWKPRL